MTQPSLADLTATAAKADGPGFTSANIAKLGGVDPLGLRQINFDLMDQVFPGLNNIARHIRPFVVVAWAWRRAKQLATVQGTDSIPIEDLRDFVDRIEVIYAWSQLLRSASVDLPGRQVLANLVNADRWTFGGVAWRKRREERRYSTAFTAPINYGPALKTLGWVEPHEQHPDVLIATAFVDPALDAFEALIADRLDHPAFSEFGSVEVTAQEAFAWSIAWTLDEVTEAEMRVMAEALFGSKAPVKRRMGGALMLAAAALSPTVEVNQVRRTMTGSPSDFVPSSEFSEAFEAWRRVQIRQLFRLSLEALFYWLLLELEGAQASTNALADALLAQVSASRPMGSKAGDWLDAVNFAGLGPIELMDRVRRALNGPSNADLALSIVDALAFCMREAPERGQDFERIDRLPLFRARREARAWSETSPKVFIRNVLESWVLAQHVYWSVGRGLADARARGKTLLRLKVVLEEGGWTLAPGASRGSPPLPTPDRLQTVLSLATECGLLTMDA